VSLFFFSSSRAWLKFVYRSPGVSEVERGSKTFLMGQEFCFYYMINTIFSTKQILQGHKNNLGGDCPECPPPWLRACIAIGILTWMMTKCHRRMGTFYWFVTTTCEKTTCEWRLCSCLCNDISTFIGGSDERLMSLT